MGYKAIRIAVLGSFRQGAHIYLLGNPAWQGRRPTPEQRSCGGVGRRCGLRDRLLGCLSLLFGESGHVKILACAPLGAGDVP